VAKKNTLAGIPIGPVLVFIVGIIVILYILKNKNLLRFGSATVGAAAGDTATGWNVYTPTGNDCTGGDGSQEIGCSGTRIWSVRSDHNTCALTNYEATGIMVFKQNASCDACGTEFDVKLGGPSHTGDNCCWWLFCINADGNGGITTGGEGPHPDTGKSCKDGVELDSIGSVEGKKIGIKAMTWANSDGTRHFEGWVDPTGTGNSWKFAAQQDVAEWGQATDCTGKATQSSSTIPSDQQVEFRCDCPDAQWEKTTVQEIIPNQRADGTTTAPTSGGSTPAGGGSSPSPPPEEEEEEEDEEDSGDDEEEEDDNGENAEEFDEDSPAAREQNDRINQCRNLTGATQRVCMAGAAQSSRGRRSNLARRRGPVTRAMLSVYSPNYFKFNRRRIRIGNVR
jgi:hypothetical protein